MNKKLVSIIIPVFNAEKTLERLINSINNQSYKNLQIIFIDDGSTDNSAKIIDNYSSLDKRIEYYLKKNGGVSSARNLGIDKACGDYICFIDSDDYYDSEFILKMLNEINLNYDLCFCGYKEINETRERIMKSKFSTKNLFSNYYVGRTHISSHSWLIKSKIIKKNNIRFNEDIKWGEDILFFSQVMSSTNKITYVPEYLAYYVVGHSGNQLSKFSLKQIDYEYYYIQLLLKDKNISSNYLIKKSLSYRFQDFILKSLNLGYK